ncbi:pentapeptide repeat-containing protein, partial [Thermodesulfobacteriota bacterium]
DLSGANLSRVHLGEANLSEADLSGADLRGANLKGLNLSRTNLKRAHLKGARLSWADLRGVNLSKTDLSRADLSKAHLKRTNLRGALLNGADLHGANLRGASLSGADLSGADLKDADLRQAIFVNTIITSRTVLTLLRRALTDEQKSAIIFSDEREIAQKKSSAEKLKNYQYLTIEFQDEVSWKNEWLALLLLSIQTTYNKCFYLSSTEETDIEIIKSKLERNCQVSAQYDIELKIIQQNPPLIIQYVQYANENVPQIAPVLSTLAALINIISKNYKTFAEENKANKKFQKIDAKLWKIENETEEKSFSFALNQTDYFSEMKTNLQKDLEQITLSTSNDVVLRATGKLLFLASKNFLIVLGALKETADTGEILAKMDKG